MFIPSIDICPAKLLSRDISGDVTSTAKSFKSWDTCMDNTACKVIAIVGIVLASLVVMWAISTVIRCVCLGFSCLEALFCCCCRSTSRGYQDKQIQPYENPNMYVRTAPPMYQQQQQYPVSQHAYVPQRSMELGSAHNGYEPAGYQVVDSHSRTDPFQDHKTSYRGNNF
ncbi:hypothetical protein CANTEDRAFT_102462 [Yamadazyma tenuis ATCC 10573]|uniref:[PSI+] induction protein 2 n=1 Tax=Candida tenuis (strain ATCC 10573 / BCRC 21748 / CBS 615 / JCM 9827 / NBRC 10315 / NRRL Y-1498 / VKM Y-70) TaxID=590646 RepID=G3AYM2_CANTC|nr:uncharacterized protein CANTEDRAFT_102462 [Yamadazyma tenuis ATCC 10573]EGV65890.1 hypothetical protein CANTEDRAFT_102462 [Yamadazyma tenuis ATCC 10573]